MVDSTAEDSATMTLVLAASHTSGREEWSRTISAEKEPSGMLGKRSELNENTKLAMIGVKMKTNASRM